MGTIRRFVLEKAFTSRWMASLEWTEGVATRMSCFVFRKASAPNTCQLPPA